MTNKEFCDRLKYMATQRKSMYKNAYPYNCCYIYGDGSISADCIGLVKSLINNPDVYNKTSPAGYFVKPGSGPCPDTTEKGILNLCTDVSYSFASLTPGEYLYMAGHAGVYVGEFTDGSGSCNVVECTPAFGGGITTSYVDKSGRRFNHRGGSQVASWEAHGKLSKYITYKKEEDPLDQPATWEQVWILRSPSGTLLKGWQPKKGKWYYLDKDGIMLTGWQKLKWSKGTDWFYFDDKNGNMLTGWQKLKWSKGTDTFYFDPESGAMVTGTQVIDGKTYKFDENGALIS